MTTWQPIQTAPTGGDLVLLWNGDAEDPMQIGFRIDVDAWCDRDGYYIYPTHWMPLPEPPKEDAP